MIKLYFFKLDGCGHCTTMKSILDDTIIQSIPNLSIEEIEHNDIDKLPPDIRKKLDTDKIYAFPELKIIKDNKAYTYSGPRTAEDISKWILQQSPNSGGGPRTMRKKYKGGRSNSRRHRSKRRPRHRRSNRYRK